MSPIIDWSWFTVRINIKASAEKLYHSWATRAGMEQWFLRLSDYRKTDGTERGKEEYVEKGDSYKWLWHGYPDDTAETGGILECNGKDLFKFSFGKAGNCTVRIYGEKGENIVELMQDEIPVTEEGIRNWHLGCKTGWTFYLANLKSLHEGGIDLRNKDENIRNVINA